MNPDVKLAESREGKPVLKSKPFIIAHISDIPAGSQYFVPNLMDWAVLHLNELKPNL